MAKNSRKATINNSPGKNKITALERLLLDNLAEVLFVSDENGTLKYVSPGFEALTGLPKEAVIGVPYKVMIHPDDLPRVEASWQSTLHAEGPRGEDFRVFTPDGEEKFIRVDGRAYYDEHGKPIGSVGIIRDVSKRRKLELELAERNAELEEANRKLARLHKMKDEFVAKLSHEVRTPLVTGLGYVELLLEGSLGRISKEASDAMQVAARNLSRLSDLMDDILNYQTLLRPEFGDKPVLTDFDPAKLINECVAELVIRTGFPLDMIKINTLDEPHMVRADKEMIHRVLNNLLDNAVKYGDKQNRIEVSLKRGKKNMTISVQDNGIGMTETVRKKVTQPFFKNDVNSPGSGLGLSIVKSILDTHGSKLAIRSIKGRGTTITFSLPLGGRPGAEDAKSKLGQIPLTSLEGAKILVVDDDPDTVEFLDLVLTSRGCDVTSASTGEEALDVVCDNDFNLFLIDLTLPYMTGAELIRKLKMKKKCKPVPSIILTAIPEKEAMAIVKRMGCDGVITKPATLSTLLDKIRMVLEKAGNKKKAVKKNADTLPVLKIRGKAGQRKKLAPKKARIRES
ncbi:MAG: response regulator [Deltaproteobacteria bacterium]|nr:response regulator [Deltaproteobacteria bacterium]